MLGNSLFLLLLLLPLKTSGNPSSSSLASCSTNYGSRVSLSEKASERRRRRRRGPGEGGSSRDQLASIGGGRSRCRGTASVQNASPLLLLCQENIIESFLSSQATAARHNEELLSVMSTVAFCQDSGSRSRLTFLRSVCGKRQSCRCLLLPWKCPITSPSLANSSRSTKSRIDNLEEGTN